MRGTPQSPFTTEGFFTYQVIGGIIKMEGAIRMNDKLTPFFTESFNDSRICKIINMSNLRRGVSPAGDATKPKYQIVTPSGIVWFKFKLTDNEICAELLSYYIAKLLGVSVAETSLVYYKNEIGIASWDIGEYKEPDDSLSYSFHDFVQLKGFIMMCLFDYLIMNEDRHARNWGYKDDMVAPLFDHNMCFGGETAPVNFDSFMRMLTSSFYVDYEYDQSQDKIFDTIAKHYRFITRVFLHILYKLDDINIPVLELLYNDTIGKMKQLLASRIIYIKERGISHGFS